MSATIREHQLAMLEILKELDRICTDADIHYMLFAGTMLGAVRHRGFIPWDDDADVVMLRPDYERFLQAAKSSLDKDRFFLQAEFSEHWPMFFSKLRMNGTACMEKFVPRDRAQHQGIYVDVFPADALSDRGITAKLQFAASKAVIAKCLLRRGYMTDSIGKKLFMGFCRILPMRPLLRFAQGRGLSETSRVHSFLAASHSFRKSIYPRSWFTETEPGVFEGGRFPVSCYADALLTTLYGDYMTASPPDERAKKVHAVLVDTENSYENYLDWQADQHYEVFTRSIR